MRLDFTEIYCHVDDFLKEYDKNCTAIESFKSKPGPSCRLSRSEILTIILGYWQSSFDCFKNYYVKEILLYHRKDFKLVSYNNFVRLIGKHLPFLVLILNALLAACNGVSFVDSTSLAVCKNYRIISHKVFKGIAKRGKTTKGWFYGLKLHLIINSNGEIIRASFSTGNKDDRKQFRTMVDGIFGKVFGDRGYISKSLFTDLFENGIELVTRVKKNMKNKLMNITDKILLLKRALIESVFSKIKLLGKFEHSRHRSPTNAFAHMVASLINYQLQKNKPSIDSLLHLS